MFVRLLLALLLAAFALPGAAPAACHDAPAVRHAMPMPVDGSDRPAAAVHACIGCIPPGDWLSPRIGAPVVARAVPLSAGVTKRLAGNTPPPDLPPPRSA